MKRILVLLLPLFLLPSLAYAESAQTRQIDCSQFPQLKLRPGQFVLPFTDFTSRPSQANIDKLAPAICRTVVSADAQAKSEDTDAVWLNGLQFQLFDEVNGGAAYESRNLDFLNDATSRRVKLAAWLLTSEDGQAEFVVGHELGHGVKQHHFREALATLPLIVVAIVIIPIAVAQLLMLRIALALKSLVAAAVLFAVGWYALSLLGRHDEIEADAFGVRALSRNVLSLKAAQESGYAFFKHFDLPEDSWTEGIKSHPSSRVRIDEIANLR